MRAVQEAAANGIQIAVATGRRFDSARLIAAQLECPLDLIINNGALVKSLHGETRYRKLLDAGVARRVIDATEEFRSKTGVIFDRAHGKQVVFEQIDWNGPFVGPYLRRHKEQVAEVAPLSACLDGEDPVEVMYIGDCEALRAIHARLAAPRLPDYSLALTEYEDRGLSMLDVLAPGVSKGAALQGWAEGQGISREEVMAVGDNWNDREMLEYAGLPVVMGNAVADLKGRGWEMTLSNDESGVAHALRRHVL